LRCYQRGNKCQWNDNVKTKIYCSWLIFNVNQIWRTYSKIKLEDNTKANLTIAIWRQSQICHQTRRQSPGIKSDMSPKTTIDWYQTNLLDLSLHYRTFGNSLSSVHFIRTWIKILIMLHLLFFSVWLFLIKGI